MKRSSHAWLSVGTALLIGTAFVCASTACEPGRDMRYSLRAHVEEAFVDLRAGHRNLDASVFVTDVRVLPAVAPAPSAARRRHPNEHQLPRRAVSDAQVCARVVTVELPHVSGGSNKNAFFHPVLVLQSTVAATLEEVLELYTSDAPGVYTVYIV